MAFFGVGKDVVKDVAAVNPRYDPTTKLLHVSPHLAHVLDWLDRVASVVTYCVRFREFSETRWAAVGARFRLICLALLVGLERLIEMVHRDADSNTHYIGGFSKLALPGVRRYIGTAAWCATPIECVALELLQDDRFFAHAPQLKLLQDAKITKHIIIILRCSQFRHFAWRTFIC